ncbi:universal stress protein [Actinomycetospora chibensis]|uniref:Universal stress protein n=1 Tax=Actinomycetospora chibensis TaxID=663606 RepID=A0ABV9RNS4_9PSEU|nr:universal stress protein [Actinomycetospora chibensis]MDD7922222.1 universal stress protein [Actinomycetospora chibensis]
MTGRPVVVGVDGSPGAARAVAWATVEAARRRRPLQVLAVLPAHGVSSVFLASDAAEEARRAVPELVVSADVRRGDPVEALLDAGRDAELLVVGSRGRGTIGSLVLGTVSAAVAARATCPTVVVRGTRVPSPDDPVVVGIDGTPSGEAAVGYAFAAADREGVPLVAVHVWQDLQDPEWGSMLDDDVSPSAAEGMPDLPEAELLGERLAGWSSKFPDVEVLRVLPEGRPVPTLVARSDDARLVVVGSHRRQGLERVLGSVGQSVLRRAQCPVAVVPPPAS